MTYTCVAVDSDASAAEFVVLGATSDVHLRVTVIECESANHSQCGTVQRSCFAVSTGHFTRKGLPLRLNQHCSMWSPLQIAPLIESDRIYRCASLSTAAQCRQPATPGTYRYLSSANYWQPTSAAQRSAADAAWAGLAHSGTSYWTGMR
jgi:hypothetical protein